MPGIGLGSTITGERSRLPSATTRSPPRHTQSLLQQFPSLPGALEWEPIPDDPKTGWRAQNRNLEKIFRMVASGFGCRGRHSVETRGEPSHRAPRREDEPPRDEAAEEDDVEDMDEDAAEEQGIIVYRRRAERDVIPPSSHHGSSGD